MARRTTSDARIADQVREALAGDPRVAPEGISVQARRGVVTLSGTVGSYRDRLAAAEQAWRVGGVVEVKNQLLVQPDRLRDPAEIAQELAEAISGDERVNARGMVIEVAEGIVRLSGTISSEAERRAAEEDAWSTEGVVDVSNELAVSADRRRPDSEIVRDVRAALDEDARISDPTLITVRSVAGTVRLEGVVSSGLERDAAEKDAWYTAGVVYVENLLRVEGTRQEPAAA